MTNKTDYLLRRPFTRRRFVTGATATAGVAALAGSGLGRRALAQGAPTLVTSIRSLSNPYHATWNQGAEAFAASVGAEHVTLVTEGNSEKGIADIRAILARTDGNVVLNVDPNDSPDARPIVEACVEAGAFCTTQWNKPDDLHPRDFNPNYVAHISFDGVPAAKGTAEALFGAIGGSGGVVALGGILSNIPAIQRKEGLEQALAGAPDIELLDFQVANWSETEAFNIVAAWLTRFGDDVKGVWAANDGMAAGALEALRAEGLAGQVPVTGIDGIQIAVEGVMSGEFAATVAWDPFWQGGMGLSIGYHAKTGAFDPAAEPADHREFYGSAIFITGDNAQAFFDSNISGQPEIDWTDIWGRVSAGIPS